MRTSAEGQVVKDQGRGTKLECVRVYVLVAPELELQTGGSSTHRARFAATSAAAADSVSAPGTLGPNVDGILSRP